MIKIAITDDHFVVLKGIESLLESDTNLKVIWTICRIKDGLWLNTR